MLEVGPRGEHLPLLDALRNVPETSRTAVATLNVDERHRLAAQASGNVHMVLDLPFDLAVQDGLVESPDEPLVKWEPRLAALNGGKDAKITWRHLGSQTSGYGWSEAPGEARSYNDYALATARCSSQAAGTAARTACSRAAATARAARRRPTHPPRRRRACPAPAGPAPASAGQRA